MKTQKTLKFTLITALTLVTAGSLFTQEMGFIDENRDGVNDWFCDADGDGVNDVNRQAYQHQFRFEDQNRDGINDNYVDADGDGVNDLSTRFTDLDGDGWNDNVIDKNHDWINDITGLVYDSRDLRGCRYGFVLEEMGVQVKNYIDENGDGSYDNMEKMRYGQYGRDRFVDEDGDGVFDGRGFYRHNQKKGRQGNSGRGNN